MRAIPRRFNIGLLCALLVLAGNTTRAQTTASLSQMSYSGIVWLFNVGYDCFPCFGYAHLSVSTPWSTPTGGEPTWSPDATQIAFTSGGDIWITSPTTEKSLTSTHNNSNPAWAPDGKRIAFVSSRGGGPEIFLMNPDGSDVVRVTYGLASKISRPAWSPDSGRIAFNCEVDLENQDICIIKRDGSGSARVTSNPAADWDPAWSPDGARIAFSTARYGGATLLAVMNPDGSQVTQIGSGIAGWRPGWSPDGRWIAFMAEAPDSTPEMPKSGIYSMTPDGTNVSFLGGSGGGIGGLDADLMAVDGGALDFAWMPLMRAPVAVITALCTRLTCSFDASHSFHNSASITSYRWEFGDGETSAERNTTHTYAVAGSYVVRLTATDERGVTGSTTQSVTAWSPPNLPPSVAIVVPIAGALLAAPATVGITATASDPDGTIASVGFYLGSSLIGTATVAPYSITSPVLSAGSYTLTAVATDNAGLSTTSASVPISVATPPTAAFTYACLALTCTFDGASSQGEVTYYIWDFGDTTGTYDGRLVTHTYSRPGTYTVSLVVSNVISVSSATRDVTVRKSARK